MASPYELVVQRFSVGFEYPVYFTRRGFDPENLVVQQAIARLEPSRRHRWVVVIDSGVYEATPRLVEDIARYSGAHEKVLDLVAQPLIVRGGEASKNDPKNLASVQGWLHDHGIDRHSVVVIVGGGAVLDMAGYAAATTHRGVRVLRMPTTVLGQGDSGVGVKNGVNAFGKKNFLGTFAPPFAVVNDADFLDTLSLRDRIGGMAEAVKVALVKDAVFFQFIVDHTGALARGERVPLSQLVARCAGLHLEHIRGGGDPFELGSARPLDYGHWAAHKLETLTDHRLRHGECVAIGMAIDALYAVKEGLCSPGVADSILRTLEALGFRLWDEALELAREGRPRLLEGLSEFREHLGGELTITLLTDIGQSIEVHTVRESTVVSALDDLRGRAGP